MRKTMRFYTQIQVDWRIPSSQTWRCVVQQKFTKAHSRRW